MEDRDRPVKVWVVLSFVLAATVGTYLAITGSGRTSGPPRVPEGGRLLRVLGPEGEPVAGGRVEVFLSRPHEVAPERVAGMDIHRTGVAALPALDVAGAEARLTVTVPGLCGEVIPLEADTETVQLGTGIPLAGHVLDLFGRPIPGARVTYPADAPFLLETRSDDAGRFELPAVPDDAWIRAGADGFVPLDLCLALYPLEDPELVFYLVRENRLSGRVVDSQGRGVPGAVIELDQEVRSLTTADDDGRFVMPGVLSDWEVVLTPRAEGWVGPAVTAEVGQDEVELVLYRPATIEGRVVDGADGEPVADFDVLEPVSAVGENGEFVLTGLLPGKTEIEVSSGTLTGSVTVEVREGETLPGVVVPVLPERWGPDDDHRPAYEVRVRLIDDESGGPAAGAVVTQMGTRRRTRAGADGVVALRFPPGRFALLLGGTFETYGGVVRKFFVPEETAFEVRLERNPEAVVELLDGSAMSGSKLWLHRRGEVKELRIRGTEQVFPCSREEPIDLMLKAKGYLPETMTRVLVPDDGKIPIRLAAGPMIRGRCLGGGGHPLPKVVAELSEDPTEARMETAGDGVFRIGPLTPGRYHLLLYARNVRSRRYDIDLTADGVDLGDVPMLAPATLSVLVVTSGNEPVLQALVETAILVPAKGLTDREGRIELPGTNEEETLRVQADGFLDGWQDVTVPEGEERVDAVVRLCRPARLVVRAVDRDGRALPVRLPRELGATRAGPGEFVLDDLPPGPFELELSDREGREGVLRTIVTEGEERVIETVLE